MPDSRGAFDERVYAMLLLLGLLLLGATGAFVGLLIADNTGGPTYDVTILGHQIATMTGLAIFLSGVALTLVVGLALAMIKLGAGRASRRRQLIRSARVAVAGRAGQGDRAPGQPAAPKPTDEVGGSAVPRTRRRLHFGH
ncbi:VIT1/CCC1 family predicted Fe2+/Mn2+ transporter [Kitasatospora herbaricolor]|uniref:hypothetical protein n=1 Tax=Kitasatospora herbaricolor TaxID=68217 RepID=UPI001749B4D2|nr:hypothetical protein [Kitasatospora herbaricolor]MDQ0312629.1 VIT1/CCC1 family predicted Fe2+/Mn2+ transporter [Kitasatospora herbaricolor]